MFFLLFMNFLKDKKVLEFFWQLIATRLKVIFIRDNCLMFNEIRVRMIWRTLLHSVRGLLKRDEMAFRQARHVTRYLWLFLDRRAWFKRWRNWNERAPYFPTILHANYEDTLGHPFQLQLKKKSEMHIWNFEDQR